MASIGFVVLSLSFVVALSAVFLLIIGRQRTKQLIVGAKPTSSESYSNLGILALFVSALLLTVCVGIISSGFFRADMTMEYVAQNYPNDPGSMQWLYLLSGLWGGRQGSLLFWTWLISLYICWVAYHRFQDQEAKEPKAQLLNLSALAIAQIILCSFIATLIFSETNNPFHATPAEYLNPDGSLNALASMWGMNKLLEHWAMVLHPPALFVGYAGLTIPFAYALAALIENQLSALWISFCQRITLFAWVFLSIGIGLGAVWAYVVLGWGGYWGWDAVENASLLSWLCATAFIHSMSVYTKKSGLKSWTVWMATLSFICVVLGTFITRSGLVQSVHAFADDKVSTVFFLLMMIGCFIACLLACVFRFKELKDTLEFDSLLSKNGSYFLTNVILLCSTVVLAYLTLAPALPTALPLGGSAIGTGAYNAVARPVGLFLLLLAALCPLLAWKHTKAKDFIAHFIKPFIATLVLFAAFAFFYVKHLAPIYTATMQEGAEAAELLAEQGPEFYYHALALAALFVGCLLMMISLSILVKGVLGRMKHKGESPFKALYLLFKKAPAQAGGYLAHFAMGMMLVGFVGSAMYVQEKVITIADTPGQITQVGDYSLKYLGSNKGMIKKDAYFTTYFEVLQGEKKLAELSPSIVVPSDKRGQQFLNAAVYQRLHEDLFVAFQGYSANNDLVLTIKINPLINLVWAGMICLILAGILAAWPKRHYLKV